MKGKIFKSIFAFALAFAIAIPTGITALAKTDTNDYKGGTKTSVEENNIPITKTIIFFNPNSDYGVREPNITFTYLAEPVTDDKLSNATVSDGTNTFAVSAGVADGVQNAIIEFSQNNKNKGSTTGVQDEKSGNFTVNLSKFTHAGVYRYKVTETSNTTPEEAGLATRDNSYNPTRYLDVYITNKEGNLQLSNAVIFKSSNNGNDSIDSNTVKTEGYDPVGETEYVNDVNVDKYYTYNLEVEKIISGNLADTTHPFPFEVNISDAKTNVKVDVELVNTSNCATSTDTEEKDISDSKLQVSAELANEDKVIIKGIPNSAKATVTETNNTKDVYDPTATLVGTSTTENIIDATTSLNANDNIITKVVKIDGDNTVATTRIVITNTLKSISPTGVVLKVAPYAIIFGAAIFLIVLFFRNKKNDEAKNVI